MATSMLQACVCAYVCVPPDGRVGCDWVILDLSLLLMDVDLVEAKGGVPFN